MADLSPNAACPCESGNKYKRCCRPLHQGGTSAPSAEALMRSRYAAYAVGAIEYVLATTHPDGPQYEDDRVRWAADVQRFCQTTRFEGLEILASHEEGDRGEVTFTAHLSRDGKDVSFSERSSFVREDGRWLYFSGEPVLG